LWSHCVPLLDIVQKQGIGSDGVQLDRFPLGFTVSFDYAAGILSGMRCKSACSRRSPPLRSGCLAVNRSGNRSRTEVFA
jgi:hypothetical protein